MTALPGQTTRQGPKFLTDFVRRHFIERDGEDDEEDLSLRERRGRAPRRGGDGGDE